MPQSDPDERLLAALRGDRVAGEQPAEAAELRAAKRIGDAARRAGSEDRAPIDDGRREETPLSFDLIEAELRRESEPVKPARVVPFRRRRSGNWVPSLAAAAVAVLAGATFFLLRGDGAESLAVVQLEPLVDDTAATAELIRDGEQLELRVRLDAASPDDGYLEVWLINGEITQLVSLGPVRQDGTYPLPEGLDPADFPVVDVSIEPLDGDPTHSGESVLRGTLEL